MTLKWLGAVMILLSCGGMGLSLVLGYKREEAMLRMLLHALKWMECELRYKLTPLPDLCRQTACQTAEPLRRIFLEAAQAIEQQQEPDAAGCIKAILVRSRGIPAKTRRMLYLLGSGLGCFDLSGQLEGLIEVQAACREELYTMREGREERIRNYQTLSLCTGAALVILLI